MVLILMLLSSSRSNLENKILKIERQSYIYLCCFRLWMVYCVKFLSISRKYRSRTLQNSIKSTKYLQHLMMLWQYACLYCDKRCLTLNAFIRHNQRYHKQWNECCVKIFHVFLWCLFTNLSNFVAGAEW